MAGAQRLHDQAAPVASPHGVEQFRPLAQRGGDERHRVWVVEARLREGQRHVNPRRNYYLDEDSYQILMADHYDANGELWRYSEAHPINFYEVPTLWTTIEIHHDLDAGRFAVYRLDPSKPAPSFNIDMEPAEFTPQALRRAGRR